jgi:profilin
LTAGKALEYAAIIGKDGNIWASNFGVAVLPAYETAVPDPNDPEKTHKENYTE